MAPENFTLGYMPTTRFGEVLDEAQLARLHATPVEVGALYKERALLAPGLIDKFVQISRSPDSTQFLPAASEPGQEPGESSERPLNISGRVCDIELTKDEGRPHIYSVVDVRWAPGTVYRQAAALSAKERQTYTPLGNMTEAFAVFIQDPPTAGSKDTSPVTWRLADVLTNADNNPQNGYIDTAAKNSGGLDGSNIPKIQELLSDSTDAFVDAYRKNKGLSKRMFRRLIDGAITDISMAVSPAFADFDPLQPVAGRKKKLDRHIKRLVAEFFDHSTSPLDWMVPYRAFTELHEIKQKIKSGEIKHGKEIETRRDAIRREVIQALAMADTTRQLNAIDNIKEDGNIIDAVNSMRVEMRVVDGLTRQFGEALGERADEESQAVAAKFKALPDVSLVVEATGGNIISHSTSVSPNSVGITAPLHYNGQTLPFNAGHGTYPQEIAKSLVAADLSGLQADGLISLARIAGRDMYDPVSGRAMLFIDLNKAPGILFEQAASNGYFAGNSHRQPTLSEMLTARSHDPRYAVVSQTEQNGIHVEKVVPEGKKVRFLGGTAMRGIKLELGDIEPAKVFGLGRRQNQVETEVASDTVVMAAFAAHRRGPHVQVNSRYGANGRIMRSERKAK